MTAPDVLAAATAAAGSGPPEEQRATYARRASGLLRLFNEAGVLGLADVHAAQRIASICAEPDETVGLACALTVRALRQGSVCLRLTEARQATLDEADESIDTSALPWPDPAEWAAACERSSMVTIGADPAGERPLRLTGGRLYLERYWLQEEAVRRQLQERWARPAPAIDRDRARAALSRLFDDHDLPPGEIDRQRLAAAVAALSTVSVIAGGPGTGKTTTVAALLTLLCDQPGPRPRIALAAPTGKAAARLTEAVHQARARLDPADRDLLGELTAQTLHRLLGWRPGTRGRFRHDASNHLPYDVIVVDEMSMVSLTLMARLLEAVRPGTRLVLVGDPRQLSPVEAGAVLADITEASGDPEPALESELIALETAWPDPERVVRRVVTLQHTWRFGGAIDELAHAIRSAEPDVVLSVLRSGRPELEFGEVDPGGPGLTLDRLAAEVRAAGRQRLAAAIAGDVEGALAAVDRHRLLCAHRRGPYGVARWSDEAERWLAPESAPAASAADGEWYVGRPVLVVANDYDLGLYNGDIGVVVATASGPKVAFARGRDPLLVAPVRLDGVQTVHAMTVHRAQGSQFECVSFVVPPADSPLLTRELFYTAVTRATARVQIFGTAEAIERAVLRRAGRASGLAERL
ncbi:exodeoxyribonuclease V subunit alpha [Microlunatus ginsengisoli]|uniref:RecBCD enzyme subunit RecD n=1 Tax=Microlunatus ginsengisoli TaxID=363863 RepID=A0ABP6ZYP5_9ACTN